MSFQHSNECRQWIFDLKAVTIKGQWNNIHDIDHFEEIMDKLFREMSIFDASLEALLEFSQLVCFT